MVVVTFQMYVLAHVYIERACQPQVCSVYLHSSCIIYSAKVGERNRGADILASSVVSPVRGQHLQVRRRNDGGDM